MNDILLQKATKIVLVGISGIYYVGSQIAEKGIIDKAFDQLFSLGLLVIVVIMLYREWKHSLRYNEKRDGILESLIRNNTEAINSFKREQKEFRKEFHKLHKRIDELQKL